MRRLHKDFHGYQCKYRNMKDVDQASTLPHNYHMWDGVTEVQDVNFDV
jgi:hypothetical protein